MRHFYAHLFDPGWSSNPGTWIFLTWTIWALSWFIAAVWYRKATARASLAQEAPYRIITAVGVIMLFGVEFASFPHGWDISYGVAWAMVALIVIGFAFAWWARIHLGALWSGTITVSWKPVHTRSFAIRFTRVCCSPVSPPRSRADAGKP
jgi:hypothetical protein